MLPLHEVTSNDARLHESMHYGEMSNWPQNAGESGIDMSANRRRHALIFRRARRSFRLMPVISLILAAASFLVKLAEAVATSRSYFELLHESAGDMHDALLRAVEHGCHAMHCIREYQSIDQ